MHCGFFFRLPPKSFDSIPSSWDIKVATLFSCCVCVCVCVCVCDGTRDGVDYGRVWLAIYCFGGSHNTSSCSRVNPPFSSIVSLMHVLLLLLLLIHSSSPTSANKKKAERNLKVHFPFPLMTKKKDTIHTNEGWYCDLIYRCYYRFSLKIKWKTSEGWAAAEKRRTALHHAPPVGVGVLAVADLDRRCLEQHPPG